MLSERDDEAVGEDVVALGRIIDGRAAAMMVAALVSAVGRPAWPDDTTTESRDGRLPETAATPRSLNTCRARTGALIEIIMRKRRHPKQGLHQHPQARQKPWQ